MSVIRKNVFSKPTLMLKSVMALLVLHNLMMWSGVLMTGWFQRYSGLYEFLRASFWYILMAEAVAVFFVFSDLILAWDERPLPFRKFQTIFTGLAVGLFILKLFAFLFDHLLPYFL